MNAVTRKVVERRMLRRPGRGAPPDAAAPAEGEAWPAVRIPIGTTAYAVSQPSRYVLVHEPVPGSAMLHPVRGVRIERDEAEESVEQMLADVDSEPPAERRTRQYLGWVVDIDGDDSLVSRT